MTWKMLHHEVFVNFVGTQTEPGYVCFGKFFVHMFILVFATAVLVSMFKPQ